MATAIDYALMAGAAYISNRDPKNQFPTPPGWLAFAHVPNNPAYPMFTGASGFEAVSFQNATNPNEIVISFAGTDSSSALGDFIYGNIPLASGISVNGADQLVDAVEYYLTVKASVPAGTPITITGHSLGGALAALVGVFFGETAYTFDQVPAYLTATSGPAKLLYDALIAKGHTATELTVLGNYVAAMDGTNPTPAATDTYANRAANITNINVQGEVAGLIPTSRIGNSVDIVQQNNMLFPQSDLHSQALLTTFLQSNQTAAPNKGLNDVTFKLPDLLKMIFDKNLFATDPLNKRDPVENFLERLVKHQAGVQPDPVTGSAAITADAMITRFTTDLWKLAQDGGLTMNDWGLSGGNYNVSRALIAFAMEKYYSEQTGSVGAGATLFQDVSGGIQFDTAAIVAAGKTIMDAKGFAQYFQQYLTQVAPDLGAGAVQFTAAEQHLITAMLPQLRDWYVQAGATGMTATDTLNRGAFMLGGTGADTLTGGAGTDLLVGNAGDDLLQGGKGNDTLLGGTGNDTYQYTNGGTNQDGLDTILDSDGQGRIIIDNAPPLAGGAQFGDARVHRDASGHTYTDVGRGTVIDGNIFVQNWQAGNLGLNMTGPAADALPPVTITGTANADIIDLGVTNITDDVIDAGAGQDYVMAGYGNDTIIGGAGNDALDGFGGNDRLYADNYISVADAITLGNTQAGTGLRGDALSGDDGNDTLAGSNGNDILSGGAGADLLIGGAGNDYIFGDTDWAAGTGDTWGVVNNVLVGGAGGIANWSGDNSDVIYAGAGDDHVWGELGNDVILGEGGADLLVGGSGNDIILGGDNNDIIYGDLADSANFAAAPGNDYLDGGTGDDVIYGNEGDDILIGGTGNDTLNGGVGQDTYLYNLGDGNDQIRDTIVAGETNKLLFGAGITLNSLKLSIGANGYMLTLGDGSTIELMSGASGTLNAQRNYTFDPQHTDIQELQFADGSSIGWADFLKRGLDQHGLLPGTVLGSDNGDRLSGANSILVGGAGSDTYTFQIGDGVVHVRDVINSGDTNTLRLGAGITSSNIQLHLGSLMLDMGNGDAVHIDNFDQNDVFYSSTIQRFEFADGTILTTDELLARGFDLNGTAGGDTITGTNTTDRINGLGGNDTLIGGEGDDTLSGGTGNDVLIGGIGSDTYVFNRGDGQDIIADGGDPSIVSGQIGNVDTLQFGADILQSDVTIRRTPAGELEFSIAGSTDTLTISGWYTADADANRIERIVFGDGSMLTPIDFENLPITGTAGDDIIDGTPAAETILGMGGNDALNGGDGNDTLDGGTGNDVLNGGAGNDTLIGGGGQDTYVMGFGMGMDAVIDTSMQGGIIQLNSALAFTDLAVTRQGDDLLLQIVGGSNEGMMLKGYYANPLATWTIRDTNNNTTTPQAILDTAPSASVVSQLESAFITNSKRQEVNSLLAGGYTAQADGSFYRSTQNDPISAYFYSKDWIMTWYDQPQTTETTYQNWRTPYSGYSIYNETATINVVNTSTDAAVVDVRSGGSWSQTITMATRSVAWENSKTRDGYHRRIDYTTTWSQLYPTNVISSYWGFGYANWPSNLISVRYHPNTTIALGHLSSSSSIQPIGGAYPSSIQVSVYDYQHTYDIQKINLGASDHTVYANWYTVVNAGTGNDTISGAGFVSASSGNITTNYCRTVYTGSGNDFIYGANFTQGSAGNDTIFTYGGSNIVLDHNTLGQVLIGNLNYIPYDRWIDYSGYDPQNDLIVAFDPGISSSDLRFAWGQVTANFERNLVQPSTYKTINISWGTNQSVQVISQTRFQFVDGSYCSYAVDGHGGSSMKVYDAQGRLASDFWQQSQGSQFGSDSYHADGSGYGEWHNADGSYATYTQAADGSYTEFNYDAAGKLTFDYWWKPDNSWGQDYFNADGSGSGENHSADGSHSNYTNDGLGVVTTNFFDSSNLALGHNISTTDAQGNVISTVYDANNVVLGVATGSLAQQVHPSGASAIQFAASISAANLAVSQNSLGDFVISYNNGASSLVVPAQSAISAPVVASFTNGANWQFVNASGNPYTYAAGSGVVYIANPSAVQFGAGITPGMVTLGLGSLMLRVGNGGDVLHIEGFNANDALAPNAIQSFSFADGTMLTYDQMLGRGFDLYGTGGNDTLSGTNLTDRMVGGAGDDVLNGGAGDDVLEGGAGNDTLIGGSGNDTYHFNLGDGADVIVDGTEGGISSNTLVLGAGITASMITPIIDANGMVTLDFGNTDSVQINQLGNLSVQHIQFADGSVVLTESLLSVAPVAVDDMIAATEGAGAVVISQAQLLANDTASNGNTLSVAHFDAVSANGNAVVQDTSGNLVLDIGSRYQSLGVGQTATDRFTYTITNAAGLTSTAAVNVTITGTNDAPVTTVDTAAVQEDLSITATGNVLMNDSDVDQGTVLSVANAGVFVGQFGQLTLQSDGSYTYALDNASLSVQSLAQGQVVTETFAYQATDGITSTPSILTVSITGTNDATVTTVDAAAVQEDLSITATGNVLTNDSDVDQGTVLAVANAGVFTGQFGQLTLNADGSYSYALDNALLGVQSLAQGQVVTETFAYQATDGITSTPSTLTVTITGTNDAPVVVADNAGVMEDLSITATGNVLANDSDVDQGTVLSVANAGVFAGQFGQLTLQADGSYSYALDNALLGVQSLAQGQVVTETFAYQANDGITSTPSTLTVTITGTNDAPVMTVDTAAVQEDLSIIATGNVLANDSDVDQGTALAVANAGVFGGQYGQLTLNADGSYSYALDNASLAVQSLAQGQVVTETFAYQATDGITSTSSSLTVTITGTNDAPVVVADNAGVMEDLSITATGNVLANDSDVDQGTVLSVANAGVFVGQFGQLTLQADGSYSYALDNASLSVQSLAQGQVVTETFAYQATDGITSTPSTLTVTITGTNDAPVTTVDTAAVQEDLSVVATGNVLANDTDVDQGTVLSVANAGVFAGQFGQLTLNADGSYSYALDNASLGVQSLAQGQVVTETFAYQATDGITSTPSTLTVTITGTNDAPVTTVDTAAVQEDLSVTATGNVLTNDSDVDQGTVLSVANAGVFVGQFGQLTLQADGSYSYALDNASLSVQSLAQGQVVTETFAYQATDGITSTPSMLTVTITGTNDAPVTTVDTAAVQEDLSITATGNVLANDSDVDQGTVLTVANAGVFAGQFGQLTLNADGSYSYALDNASLGVQSLAQGQVVTETFAYQASDGITSTPSTLTVTITGTNDAPVTTVDTASVQEDLSITATGNVLANDSDVDQGTVLTVANAGVFAGQFGQLTLNADGSYSYALDNASLGVQSLAQGQVVTETFAYQATDGITSTPSTLTVTITGTNDAPVTTVDTAAVQEDLSITATGNVLTNDSDVDQGTVLSVANAGVFVGQFGQLTLNADGSYSYALDNASLGVQSLAQGQVVTETFEYQATDGITSTPSTLTVTITGTNDAPVTTVDAAAVQEDMSVTATGNVLMNDSDVDQGTVLTVANAGVFVGQFGQLTLQTDGSYTYALDNASLGVQSLAQGQVVTETFAYQATDGIAVTPSTLTVTITGTNDAPVVASAIADQHTIEDVPFSFTVPSTTFTDIDQGDVLTYHATMADGSVLPSWLKFDAATLTFSGIPSNWDVGVLNVSVRATDTGGLSATDTFALDVQNVNDAPIVSNHLADQHIEEDHRFNIVVPANTFDDWDIVHGDSLSYSATLADGDTLPDWLKFDATTRSFSGKVEGNDNLDILLTATDQAGASVSQVFNLSTGKDHHDQHHDDNVAPVDTNQNEIIVSSTVNDIIHTGNGADTVVFQRGDGRDTVYGGVGTDNTVVLAGGIQTSDIALSKQGNDLILEVGHTAGQATEQITFRNWYDTGANYKSVLNLEIINNAVADFDRKSGHQDCGQTVDYFDFTAVVNAFDQACGTGTTFQHWNATNSLVAAHLEDTHDSALDGSAFSQESINSLLANGSAATQNVLDTQTQQRQSVGV